jgi:hypothetical protein
MGGLGLTIWIVNNGRTGVANVGGWLPMEPVGIFFRHLWDH